MPTPPSQPAPHRHSTARLPSRSRWRPRRLLILGALGAMAVAAQGTALARSRLSHQRLLGLALRESSAYGDARPRRIEFAVGRLKRAMHVIAPSSTVNTPTSSGGAEQPGEANSLVALVLVRGVFVSHGPHPRGTPAPSGHILEFVIDERTGSVEATSLSPRVRVPLSRLGAVTRLR